MPGKKVDEKDIPRTTGGGEQKYTTSENPIPRPRPSIFIGSIEQIEKYSMNEVIEVIDPDLLDLRKYFDDDVIIRISKYAPSIIPDLLKMKFNIKKDPSQRDLINAYFRQINNGYEATIPEVIKDEFKGTHIYIETLGSGNDGSLYSIFELRTGEIYAIKVLNQNNKAKNESNLKASKRISTIVQENPEWDHSNLNFAEHYESKNTEYLIFKSKCLKLLINKENKYIADNATLNIVLNTVYHPLDQDSKYPDNISRPFNGHTAGIMFALINKRIFEAIMNLSPNERERIIHGDISSRNIMLKFEFNKRGEIIDIKVELIDFDRSKRVDNSHQYFQLPKTVVLPKKMCDLQLLVHLKLNVESDFYAWKMQALSLPSLILAKSIYAQPESEITPSASYHYEDLLKKDDNTYNKKALLYNLDKTVELLKKIKNPNHTNMRDAVLSYLFKTIDFFLEPPSYPKELLDMAVTDENEESIFGHTPVPLAQPVHQFSILDPNYEFSPDIQKTSKEEDPNYSKTPSDVKEQPKIDQARSIVQNPIAEFLIQTKISFEKSNKVYIASELERLQILNLKLDEYRQALTLLINLADSEDSINLIHSNFANTLEKELKEFNKIIKDKPINVDLLKYHIKLLYDMQYDNPLLSPEQGLKILEYNNSAFQLLFNKLKDSNDPEERNKYIGIFIELGGLQIPSEIEETTKIEKLYNSELKKYKETLYLIYGIINTTFLNEIISKPNEYKHISDYKNDLDCVFKLFTILDYLSLDNKYQNQSNRSNYTENSQKIRKNITTMISMLSKELLSTNNPKDAKYIQELQALKDFKIEGANNLFKWAIQQVLMTVEGKIKNKNAIEQINELFSLYDNNVYRNTDTGLSILNRISLIINDPINSMSEKQKTEFLKKLQIFYTREKVDEKTKKIYQELITTGEKQVYIRIVELYNILAPKNLDFFLDKLKKFYIQEQDNKKSEKTNQELISIRKTGVYPKVVELYKTIDPQHPETVKNLIASLNAEFVLETIELIMNNTLRNLNQSDHVRIIQGMFEELNKLQLPKNSLARERLNVYMYAINQQKIQTEICQFLKLDFKLNNNLDPNNIKKNNEKFVQDYLNSLIKKRSPQSSKTNLFHDLKSIFTHKSKNPSQNSPKLEVSQNVDYPEYLVNNLINSLNEKDKKNLIKVLIELVKLDLPEDSMYKNIFDEMFNELDIIPVQSSQPDSSQYDSTQPATPDFHNYKPPYEDPHQTENPKFDTSVFNRPSKNKTTMLNDPNYSGVGPNPRIFNEQNNLIKENPNPHMLHDEDYLGVKQQEMDPNPPMLHDQNYLGGEQQGIDPNTPKSKDPNKLDNNTSHPHSNDLKKSLEWLKGKDDDSSPEHTKSTKNE